MTLNGVWDDPKRSRDDRHNLASRGKEYQLGTVTVVAAPNNFPWAILRTQAAACYKTTGSIRLIFWGASRADLIARATP